MTGRKPYIRIAVASGVGALVLIAGAGQAGAVTAGPVAGYTAPASANPTQTVAATFVVPTSNCKKTPSTTFQAVLAGARLTLPGGNTGGGAVMICAGTMAAYVPLIQINGSSIGSGITVNPGDTISTTLSEGPGGTTVTLTDGGQNQTASGPGGSATAESVGDIAVNCTAPTCSPVPKVTVTPFSSASIDGLNLAAAGSVQGTLTDAAGATEMTSSALKTKKTLNSFKVKWVMSCAAGSNGGC
jgi:hypothetical protein